MVLDLDCPLCTVPLVATFSQPEVGRFDTVTASPVLLALDGCGHAGAYLRGALEPVQAQQMAEAEDLAVAFLVGLSGRCAMPECDYTGPLVLDVDDQTVCQPCYLGRR